ncbi:Conserved_hypothetical protein [Hexamita inflata]|uniref:Uncharacterized protein n=1 Tax=Hexamita inflata TaxID=28002 RepID=A0AA86R0J6_9EUKA|nr:Conserved hypothetical protein [Hexamita inflata]
MKAFSEPLVQSSFPLFALQLSDDLTVIGGGGGASKSGVPNQVQVYKNQELLTHYDFGSDLVIALYQIEQTTNYIVLTTKSVNLLQLEADKLTLINSHALSEEPQGYCYTPDFLVVGFPNKLVYFTFNGKVTIVATQDIKDNVKITRIQSFAKNFLVVITKQNILKIALPKQFNEKSAEDQKEIEIEYPNAIVQLNENTIATLVMNKKTNKTNLIIFDQDFKVIKHHFVKGLITNLVYSGELFYTMSSEGLIQVFDYSFKLLLKKQTEITEMITNMQVNNKRIVVTGIDAFQTIKLEDKSVSMCAAMSISCLIVSFIYVMMM